MSKYIPFYLSNNVQQHMVKAQPKRASDEIVWDFDTISSIVFLALFLAGVG